MSPEQNRKFNLVAGGLFLAMGLVTWGLTAYYAVTPNPTRPAPVSLSSVVDLASCRAALTAQGYQSTMSAESNSVKAFESFAPDTKAQLDRVTMNIGLCKMVLKEFCMGEGCEAPGVSFELVSPTLPDAKALKAGSKGAKEASTPAAKPSATPSAKPGNGAAASGAPQRHSPARQ